MTAPLRKSPDFIIIGAQKSGTSSLFTYLEQHPDVALSEIKELHYFDDHYHLGMNKYKRHFPFLWSHKKCGEASPYYFFHPSVPKRIHQSLKGTKFIVMLRDPVKRAYSHYKHMLRYDGVEELDFLDALKAEPERLLGENEKLKAEEIQWSSNHTRFSYTSRGRYAEQINEWLEFFEMDCFHFIKSESFFKNTFQEMNKVYDFLELEPFTGINLAAQNKGKYEDAPSQEAIDFIRENLKEDQEELIKLLGKEFSWD
ncbi:MAG: sulfotransferase [Vicingaceae bacterium]